MEIYPISKIMARNIVVVVAMLHLTLGELRRRLRYAFAHSF